MNFLLIIIVFLVSEAGLIWHLINSSFFRPYLETGDADLTNVILFLVMVSSFVGLLVTLLVYLGEKFLYCGRNEFPSNKRALKFGFISFLCLLLLLILHVFHFLNFWVALIIVLFVIIVSVVVT